VRKAVSTSAGVAVALACLTFGSTAHAEEDDEDRHLAIALDGHLSAAVNAGSNPIGGGFAARAGVHYGLPTILALRPEAMGSYTRLMDQDIGRLGLGGRFGVDFLLGVYAYGHMGYGWNGPADGFAFDVGAAVDLRIFPIVNPGVHLEYVNIVDLVEIANAGVHVELLF